MAEQETGTSQRPKLENGAVAILDALGFKGIWNEPHPARVVDALASARDAARRSVKFHNYFGSGKMHVAAFSDTIIVTVQDTSGRSLLGITHAVASVCAAKGPVPIAFRGCIAAGKLLVSEDVFIGGAMDEGAAWYERADASLTWFTPTAVEALGTLQESDIDVLQWSVPLKGGGALDTLVVNPFSVLLHGGTVAPKEGFDDLERRLLERLNLSHQVDVVQKRQNTARFLAAAREYTLARIPKYLEMVVSALEAATGNKEGDNA